MTISKASSIHRHQRRELFGGFDLILRRKDQSVQSFDAIHILEVSSELVVVFQKL